MILAKKFHQIHGKNMRMKDRLPEEMTVIQTITCFPSVEHSKVSKSMHTQIKVKERGVRKASKYDGRKQGRMSVHLENMKKHANERDCPCR